MKLSISVTEASSVNDTITFQIITKARENSTIDFTFASPVYRTYQQLNWLYSRLCLRLPEYVIPPIPEPPIPNLLDDLDYINRKRVQVERFLQKLGNRSKFVENMDFKYFLTNNMTHDDSLDGKMGKKLGFLNNIIKPNYERGFRIYRPSEPIEENNAEEFQMRVIYVLRLEDQFNAILDNVNEMIKQREALGACINHVGDCSLQALNSKFRMGHGKSINNVERHKQYDSMLHLFGTLTNEVHYLLGRQATMESIIFGDVFLEYRNIIEAIKTVMNNRTEKLVEYVNAVKQRNKKYEKAEKLKSVKGLDSSDVQVAIAEESKLTENVQKEKEEFINVQKTVTRELIRFKKEKSDELNKILKEYSELQLRFEKQKLKALTSYLNKLKNISSDEVADVEPQSDLDNIAEFQVKSARYDGNDFNIDQKKSPEIFQRYDPLNVTPI
ncbi:13983_t:CDS:2 [Funneliformis mosseae]|uniref:13983_t:CDS:1 n=1 Tax=Funneliformis mosseae TaxID=27381 RepID=A0A9N9G379_FUNMO|nr:13983_t:CDS:2 [Funneliformis mosseae]